MPISIFTTPLNDTEALLTEPHIIGDGLLVFADTSIFGSPSSTAPVRVCANFAGTSVIFKVTGKTSTTLVINSAIEGTADISLAAGVVISVDVTAGYLMDAYSAINRLEGIGATIGLPISGGTPSGVLYHGGNNTLSEDASNFKYDGFSHTLFVDNLIALGTMTFSLGVGTPLVNGTPSGVLYHGGTGLLADDPSFLYDGFSNTLFVENFVASGTSTIRELFLGTMPDSGASFNTLYFSSDHLDGHGDPQLCRRGPSSNVTIIG